ncbi:hypothetical protein [Arundinibacter roseus]|uniref:hypothetical protein n=1 Tax=Arundinibacter roseus TaxID=2070510 RepID=UPI0014052F10|nr:hypothetical protein [Arundinibacter roseus]
MKRNKIVAGIIVILIGFLTLLMFLEYRTFSSKRVSEGGEVETLNLPPPVYPDSTRK